MPIARQAVAVGALITEAVDLAGSLAITGQVRLRSESAADLPKAWADPAIVLRVLQNLVGNAVKFTPLGGDVDIQARLANDGERIEVSVRDTGPGIPEELCGRLFTKFATARQKGCGSGLGLAFCRLAIEAHGDRIWAENRSGGGAVFVFTLGVAP